MSKHITTDHPNTDHYLNTLKRALIIPTDAEPPIDIHIGEDEITITFNWNKTIDIDDSVTA
jgi:hypothetical protein